MGIVRQLPKIYLRGALANQTMKKMTQQQIEEVGEIIDFLFNHPVLQSSKNKFARSLSETIGADYSVDREAAYQEFRVALWRGVVYLFYDASYSYKCRACESDSYICASGHPTKFDREYQVCPNCNCVELFDGTFADYDSNRDKDSRSCIQPIKVKERSEDPEVIMNDEQQLSKFFTAFIWNYLKQIIKENSITTHGVKNKPHFGFADKLTADSIAAILQKHKIPHSYNFNDGPVNGEYTIYCDYLQIPQKTIDDIVILLGCVKRQSNVVVKTDNRYISVISQGANAKMINVDVICNEMVSISNSSTSSEGEGSSDWINNTSEDKVYEIDRIDESDMFDGIGYVRKSLPNIECRKIFDIILGYGKHYENFHEEYPDKICYQNGIPRNSKIAKHLGISTSEVKKHMSIIKMKMLSCDLV